MSPRQTIAVIRASGKPATPRLFAALEQVFPVRFEDRPITDLEGTAAIIAVGTNDLPPRLPVPALATAGEESNEGETSSHVRFRRSVNIDRRLWGWAVSENHLAQSQISTLQPEGEVIAATDGRAVWTVRDYGGAQSHFASLFPGELAEGDTLKDRLRSGRSLAFLPLFQLIRQVTGYDEWQRPCLRASFLFDDPNLHWRSYGYVRFKELRQHASEHGYHVGFATVPIDFWFVARGAVREFQAAGDRFSLVFHGNDHVYAELAERHNVRLVPALAQAVGRAIRFEARSGLRVARIMVAPHGRYSEQALDVLRKIGFEALCGHYPEEWVSCLPFPENALGHWHAAEIRHAGLPILLRYDLAHPRPDDEFLFWSLLDKPLVVYGHHQDLENGLHVLEHQVRALSKLGDVSWHSLEDILRSNVFARRIEDTLYVVPYSRRFTLDLPDGVRELIIKRPADVLESDEIVVAGSPAEVVDSENSSTRLVVAPGHRRIEVSFVSRARLGLRLPPLWAGSGTALVRRAIGESRDRLRPGLRRLGLEHLLRSAEGRYAERAYRRRRGQD